MKKFLLGNNKNDDKKSFIWNILAGIINASESVIILIVITRTNSLSDAGIMTIAFSVANLFVTIGKFGVRNLQATDVTERFQFSKYFIFRIITTLLMIFSVLCYLLYGSIFLDYSNKKIAVVFMINLIFVVESIEDVYAGRFQQKNRLDIGAKIFSIRWVMTIGVFVLAAVLTKNLLITVIMAFIISVICMIYMIHKVSCYFISKPIEKNYTGIIELFREAFPLFISSFLSFYIINAPRYAIDAYLSEEVQACYGFISMPVFVIALVNGFIYQPDLVNMTIEWNENHNTKFIQRIVKQMVIIFLITVVCLIGAYSIGIPVLSFVFNTSLMSYKRELLILLLGGGMLAVVGYLSIILTIIRHQKDLLGGYVFIALCALLLSGVTVKNSGVFGAALLYLGLVSVLAIIFSIIVCYRIVIERNENGKKII